MSTFIARSARILTFCLCAFALSSCNINSEISLSNVDPDFSTANLHGVLVVAVARTADNRVEFEDTFTKALKRNDVDAIASHTLVPAQNATADDIIAAAKQAHLDTILITRYIGESSADVYHPGAVYYAVTPAYDPGYYGNFGGYYGHAVEVAYQQPVWTSNVRHTMITDLYVVSTQKRPWQAVSETIQASDASQVMDDAVDALIDNLKEKRLLH
jgi:hypothetical protein